MSEPKELEPARYDEVIEAMKEIIDPEIGVNIVDLGLVYGLQESEDGALLINMTLTSAGCPLTWLRRFESTGFGCHHGDQKRSPRTAKR